MRAMRNFNFNFLQGQYFLTGNRYISTFLSLSQIYSFLLRKCFIFNKYYYFLLSLAKQIRQLVTISTISFPLSWIQPRPTSQYIYRFPKGKFPNGICLCRYNAQPFTQRLLTSPKKKGREKKKWLI